MRDEQGTYIGHHLCSHYRGVEGYQVVECCGGRQVRKASVRCAQVGVIMAEPQCSSSGCSIYRRERKLAMRRVSEPVARVATGKYEGDSNED